MLKIIYIIMAFVYGSTFRLDNTGEVIIESGGDISLVTEYDKIFQDLNVILRSQKNQYLFNKNFGVNYIDYLNGNLSTYYITKEISDAIKSYYFVNQINSINVTIENGNVNVNADILLINGNKIKINTTL